MMSKKLESIINSAIKLANQRNHEYLTLEGLLLVLLKDDDQVVRILKELGVDVGQLIGELEEFYEEPSNFSILSDFQIEELSKKQFVDDKLRKLALDNGIRYQPEISLSVQRVIQRAAIHIQSSGKSQIRGTNILIALFQEKESFALYSIRKYGIERFDVVKQVAHDVDKPMTQVESEENNSLLEQIREDNGGEGTQKERSVLESFTVNLNKLAEEGKVDPLIGREQELKRIVQVLCRRRKNNPLMVGEAGVGKTAIAEGLAWSVVHGKVPEILSNAVVFSLDMASLLAGAKFRGDFEQRLKAVLKEIEKIEEEGLKPVLFIDEMHTIMGAGATGGGSMDASNLLKPALSQGRLRCLGSTTHEEYRKFIEKDSAFSRRFQKIDIDEPSLDETYKILQGLKPRFEEHHSVKIPNSVLKAAVDLSFKYLLDRRNPDKSIDVIDEAGAAIQLLPKSKRKSSITKRDVEKIVAQLAKIPHVTVENSEKDKLKKLKENLQLLIFGQDHAIEQVCDAILMSRSGLGDESKPIASFLFAGPTGVGKTELARQLAINLGTSVQRFDMSEFMEKHSVAKLIGAPPGYVGHEEGGLLTDAIKKNPNSVLLLDEIEKAHGDIFNILLQVMDHGELTDSQGRSTSFKNTVIIMTTNAGANEMESSSVGLIGEDTAINESKRDKAIKNFFTPEFRNRLDAIVHFNKLSNEKIVQIVDKFLIQLQTKLEEKGIELSVDEDVKNWLAKTGYDPKMGARPISRLIDQQIKKPLSQEILFGKLAKGGKVTVHLPKNGKNEVSFSFEE